MRGIRSIAVLEREALRMLRATVPDWLRDKIDFAEMREWVREHIEAYEDDRTTTGSAEFPWVNTTAYDDWERDSLFVVLVLRESALELFCGTGKWPAVRKFMEGDAEGVPADRLHAEWAARFCVPCAPLVLSRALVAEWIGRGW
jgi:hypothetical protein